VGHARTDKRTTRKHNASSPMHRIGRGIKSRHANLSVTIRLLSWRTYRNHDAERVRCISRSECRNTERLEIEYSSRCRCHTLPRGAASIKRVEQAGGVHTSTPRTLMSMTFASITKQFYILRIQPNHQMPSRNKKLGFCRGTARHSVSFEKFY